MNSSPISNCPPGRACRHTTRARTDVGLEARATKSERYTWASSSRTRWRKRFVILLSVVPVLLYWFLRSPVQMVVAGGIAQALMLPLIGAAALYLRYRQLPDEVQPSGLTTALLWISTMVMLAFALYYVMSRLA